VVQATWASFLSPLALSPSLLLRGPCIQASDPVRVPSRLGRTEEAGARRGGASDPGHRRPPVPANLARALNLTTCMRGGARDVTPPLPSPAVPPACLPPSSPLATRRRAAAHVARGRYWWRARARRVPQGGRTAATTTRLQAANLATSSSPTTFGGSRSRAHHSPARHLRVVARIASG
jgi:hypothetical protein